MVEVELNEIEKQWIKFFFQSNNKRYFGVLKLLVNSKKSFSRAGLFKEAVAIGVSVPEKRTFDVFVSSLIADGLLIQGDWKVTCFGKEIPLSCSGSLRKVFGFVVEWNNLVFDVRGKGVWD